MFGVVALKECNNYQEMWRNFAAAKIFATVNCRRKTGFLSRQKTNSSFCRAKRTSHSLTIRRCTNSCRDKILPPILTILALYFKPLSTPGNCKREGRGDWLRHSEKNLFRLIFLIHEVIEIQYEALDL